MIHENKKDLTGIVCVINKILNRELLTKKLNENKTILKLKTKSSPFFLNKRKAIQNKIPRAWLKGIQGYLIFNKEFLPESL